MRLHEFLTITKGEPTGTFIGVRPTERSTLQLTQWARDVGLTEPVDPKDLHCTLIFDKYDSIPWNSREYSPPLKLDPRTYQLDELGGALVLRFDCPQLEERHQWAKDEFLIDWPHQEYITHITLSYAPNLSACDLTPPKFPIELSHEFSEFFGASGPSVTKIE